MCGDHNVNSVPVMISVVIGMIIGLLTFKNDNYVNKSVFPAQVFKQEMFFSTVQQILLSTIQSNN